MATRTATSTLKKQQSRPVAISRWRIRALLFLVLLLVVRIAIRLGEVQVLQHEQLSTMARGEIDQQVTLMPERGVISDSAGNVLAMDVDRESLWAVPKYIDPERAPRLALTLATLLKRDPNEIQEILTNDKLYWLPVARWLDPQVAEQIELLEEPGLVLQYEPRRVYPQGSFAGQVVGAVNNNGDGISGVESYFNSEVKGITGTLTAEWDSHSNPIWIAPYEKQPARDGADLTLTIDPLIQHTIETALEEAVVQHQASGGTVIVMDTKTGAVLGMTSYPFFDPNNWQDYPAEQWQNPAVSTLYEPGSTFKIITAAAALQSRKVTADTTVYDGGVISRYGETLGNWNRAGNGELDLSKMLYYSSNVAALQFMELTGEEAFYATVERFGFGKPTGIDIGGEQAGIVNWPGSPDYNPIVPLTNSYGQGIAVSPLQMVRAMAAIANDGLMMRPYVVAKRCLEDNCVETQPEEVGQVVDKEVAWTIRQMLIHSANHYAGVVWGSRTGNYGDAWLVPGYAIGAKTGTSSIPDGRGGYEPYTIGSVLGFGPNDNPRYAVLVKIDRPKDDIWGVNTAIPVYHKIMEQLMRYARIAPDPALRSEGQ
jgi:Cell division protein FtsI/penicillin-binding protein 2